MEEKILNSKAFKELDPVTQIIYKNPRYIHEVINGYDIAKDIGIENYNYFFSPGPYKLKIITELINNDNDNTQRP